MNWYRLLKPLLFCLPAETAHAVTMTSLAYCQRLGLLKSKHKNVPSPQHCFGLNFPNRLGVAAGLDKNGDYIDALLALGFGFVEVGAVTPLPQPGNRKPRLHRLPAANALINHMGFNNKGVNYLKERLQKRKLPGIVGVNIGKNLTTPLEDAINDYSYCFTQLYPYVDFVTINISSPNTPNLRQLQGGDYLHQLLKSLKQRQSDLTQQWQKNVPLLVKVSPDLTAEDIEQMAVTFLEHNIEGVIATNTSLSRQGVTDLPGASLAGGLSGRPLVDLSLNVIQQFAQCTSGQLPLIGVGGIDSVSSAQAHLAAGASLLQVYTGLVYQGPGLVKTILNAIS